MLKFDNLLCLVTDHAHSSCRACVTSCYKNAFSFANGKIVFDEQLCTNCAACVGGCPTEAISFEEFNREQFVLINSEKTVSCKKNTPCLAIFAPEHFVVLAKNSKISCDLSSCETCEINLNSVASDLIKNRIDIANSLLHQIQSDLIDINYTKEPSSRRDFFMRVANSAKKSIQVAPEKFIRSDFNQTPTPKYKIIFQNRLKEIEKDLISPLFHTKIIDDNCTACSECVRICPTKALYWHDESLVINSSRCIGCSLCEIVCKYDAIKSPEIASSKPYINGEITTLKKFNFIECEKCATPFIKVGEKTQCRECDIYYSEFADMFTPAYKIDR